MTLNVGTIRAGQRTNVVPDECVFTVDRRVLPGESLDDAVEELRRFVGDRAELGVEHVGAAFETSADHWLARMAQAVVQEVRGRPVPVRGLVGSSDARYYATGAGLSTILLGPGSMDQAHVADEWIDIELLGQSVEVYRRLALLLLARPEEEGS